MFKDIKVGDKVILHTWLGLFSMTHHYKVKKVTKVNKITFKIEDSTQTFTKDDGSVYGGDCWTRTAVIKYNENNLQLKAQAELKEEQRKCADTLSKFDFSKLPIEVLHQINNIINEANK